MKELMTMMIFVLFMLLVDFSYAASVTLRCDEVVGADGYFVQMSRDLVTWNEERDAGNNVINGKAILTWENVPTDGNPVYFRLGAYIGDFETGARSVNTKAGCWYIYQSPPPWGCGVEDIGN